MNKRVEVLKTYKLYIGGKFSRTESGRYFKLEDKKGHTVANLCQSSRKDFRNSVVVARKAQIAWEERSAYNKGQILYRIAENLEGRKSELADLISAERKLDKKKADEEVNDAIDTFLYFAGWTDKYQAIFSSVNPVASSHFNFSILEALGVVSSIMGPDNNFQQLAALISAAIAGGNTLITLVPAELSLSAMTLAEVIHHSDVPAGVVNILTGFEDELLEHMAGHMDVNALLYWGDKKETVIKIRELSESNLKRSVFWPTEKNRARSPYSIYDLQEIKTTWHPIEQIGGATSAY